ncbi:50S ribosomal protein L10 [bacterium]|nr:50S ribosomal protein L10 [candidate division CSSED10-310 bacterium]
MKRTEKETKVNEIQNVLLQASSAVFLDYRGLNVEQITILRNKLREVSVDFQVVKNTLTKRASDGTKYSGIGEFLKGPTAAAISKGDPVAGFKIIDEFTRTNPNLKFKIAVIDGKTINQQQMMTLADLPSREVLLGRLLGTMQAPVAALVRVLAGNLTGLLNVLNGIKESKAS